MEVLATHLSTSIDDSELTTSDKRVWDSFTSKAPTIGLENALHDIDLSVELSNRIVDATWRLVSAADQRVIDRVIADPLILPLSKLFKHLLSSTNDRITVVTTNYDRLAEYSADVAKFFHNTGFGSGYLRYRLSDLQPSITYGHTRTRSVDVWKVHGCLDWFENEEGRVLGITASKEIPKGMRPAIVTPGVTKYERTHSEPFRSILTKADESLSRANAYLCIGFGFNDAHIQPKLLDRWKDEDTPLVILTKTLSKQAEAMLLGASNRRFLTLEESHNGTFIRSQQHQDGLELPGKNLWQLSEFLNCTT